MGGDVIRIEVDQDVARADRVAVLHARVESPAFELDRVQAHVHEDLDALARRERHRVSRRVHQHDGAVARGREG